MILVPAPIVDHFGDADKVVYPDPSAWRSFDRGIIPGGTLVVRDFRVGEARYRLRRPMRGYFLRERDGRCLFLVDGFYPAFVGQGERAEDAYDNWHSVLHEEFQSLYSKRSFEMTEEERRQWGILSEMIDVVGYRNETPTVIRQIGCVSRARLGQSRQITWTDGRRELVDFAQMPPEFAGYAVGQYFEADVEREPLSWKLRRVRHVQRMHSLPPMTETQAEEFWNSLPGSSSLPESNRDWTES